MNFSSSLKIHPSIGMVSMRQIKLEATLSLNPLSLSIFPVCACLLETMSHPVHAAAYSCNLRVT